PPQTTSLTSSSPATSPEAPRLSVAEMTPARRRTTRRAGEPTLFSCSGAAERRPPEPEVARAAHRVRVADAAHRHGDLLAPDRDAIAADALAAVAAAAAATTVAAGAAGAGPRVLKLA